MVVVEQYPIELGWAFLLLVGYLVRLLFVSFRLPGPVGIMFVGYAFSHFFQKDIYENRDQLQRFAFLLVLLNAGFEVSVRRLRPAMLLVALLPATLEILGIALMATLTVGMAFREGAVLGCVLFPLGEGLVIPKMNEFKHKFPNHPLPRVTLTWAPLEATFALSLFSFLSSLSSVMTEGKLSIVQILLDVLGRLVATIVTGGLIGGATGWLLSRSSRLTIRRKRVFTGSAVEAFLIVLALAFLGFGLAEIVPNGIAKGSLLFDADLFVIAIGSSFSEFADPSLLHSVENYLASVWVFGCVILFSMLGSRTEVSVFTDVSRFFPFMLTGVFCRFVGFCVVVPLARLLLLLSGQRFSRKKMALEVIFLLLCSLPRATLQGALGSKPMQERFFSHDSQGMLWQAFISDGAKLYILFFSVMGSLLLELLGTKLLRATTERPRPRLSESSAQLESSFPSVPHSGSQTAGLSSRTRVPAGSASWRPPSSGVESGEGVAASPLFLSDAPFQEQGQPSAASATASSFPSQSGRRSWRASTLPPRLSSTPPSLSLETWSPALYSPDSLGDARAIGAGGSPLAVPFSGAGELATAPSTEEDSEVQNQFPGSEVSFSMDWSCLGDDDYDQVCLYRAETM